MITTSQHNPKHTIKVLVCDDDPTYRMIMRDTLESEGFVVFDAADGEAALTQFFAVKPDIVLLDVQMPILGGFEVCQQIRATDHGKDIPVLMVTGADDYVSIDTAYSVGATDFLPKPIKWPMIPHRIKYMLRSREAMVSLKESEERLRYLAYYDSLTGLPNRQYFKEQLEAFINLAKRGQYHVAILFIDLDRFKRINDTLGHSYGDKLLQEVAKKLQSNLRQSDFITRQPELSDVPELARLGGDEFTIFLSNVVSVDAVTQVAQRLLNQLSEPIKLEKYEVVVTPSIGISFYPHDGDTVDSLLKNADAAMYFAKESGRGCFKFYSESLNSRAVNRLKLEESLRDALKNDDFELYFQPQVRLSDHKICHVEALLRWQHPELGFISPAEFIPIAEDSGFIVDIGHWVLTTACLQAKAWLDTLDEPIGVAVNISGRQFKSPSFIDDVASVLKETQLPAHLLELELTESVVMSNVQENIVRLHGLKRMGVSLSVDDFGTGYSSLSYLKRFPIDTLKIDRSFIIDIANDENDLAIVAAVLALANSLKLNVVAEGVETQSQLQMLEDLQPNKEMLIQGYYFHRPMPAVDCNKLFAHLSK
ncbi:EAL domain-containing protein [Aliiglaciecola sp. LCG003]|uniref:two-component system response regulator n=1 Tax=Aliiglaciecola sp. LCG003 TaxID=3053655 RepID=UPI0025748CAB|nr:EAL domain-containing protein [Aliiglaciecola sp. LCG003]WJG07933.1 EAL domain-containing protein [Aliiglaciecola sp. LCG003]